MICYGRPFKLILSSGSITLIVFMVGSMRLFGIKGEASAALEKISVIQSYEIVCREVDSRTDSEQYDGDPNYWLSTGENEYIYLDDLKCNAFGHDYFIRDVIFNCRTDSQKVGNYTRIFKKHCYWCCHYEFKYADAYTVNHARGKALPNLERKTVAHSYGINCKEVDPTKNSAMSFGNMNYTSSVSVYSNRWHWFYLDDIKCKSLGDDYFLSNVSFGCKRTLHEVDGGYEWSKQHCYNCCHHEFIYVDIYGVMPPRNHANTAMESNKSKLIQSYNIECREIDSTNDSRKYTGNENYWFSRNGLFRDRFYLDDLTCKQFGDDYFLQGITFSCGTTNLHVIFDDQYFRKHCYQCCHYEFVYTTVYAKSFMAVIQ